jgi:hypothetical protein
MDLIKVNGNISFAIKTAVKAKNAGLGGEDSTIILYCLGAKIGHVHNTSEVQMVTQIKLSCGILSNGMMSFCENRKST